LSTSVSNGAKTDVEGSGKLGKVSETEATEMRGPSRGLGPGTGLCDGSGMHHSMLMITRDAEKYRTQRGHDQGLQPASRQDEGAKSNAWSRD
jgi:hypothetical protein